ncbi:MAG: hypothetical protein OD918_11880 [Gammaproteobacteria bacterium]
MPESWIPVTIAAAFSKTCHAALQKHLQDRLSVAGILLLRTPG